MRIAVLVKQIPATDSLLMDADGRLVRFGVPLEMNPFCRRAVSMAISLAKQENGQCTAFTLAPESGEDLLREAVAAGVDRAVLITDPAFAGSDTLAAARALACALRKEGPFDLVVCGRNSVDADTGQVGPQVAQLLDLPFIANARNVSLQDGELSVLSERDDGCMKAQAMLPAVISVAERSCEPARANPAARAAVSPARIRRLSAADLGAGPWGQAGSPTRVSEVRAVESTRQQIVLDGPAVRQVEDAIQLLVACGAFASRIGEAGVGGGVARAGGRAGPVVVVILEPRRRQLSRELATAGAILAEKLDGTTVGVALEPASDELVASLGLDALVVLAGAIVEEDAARAVAQWTTSNRPRAIVAPATLWGREVAARVAASLGLGLVGDAVDLDVAQGRVFAWKPALGDRLMARITVDSEPQMVTLRPGALRARAPRAVHTEITTLRVVPRERVRLVERTYDEDADALFSADTVVGIGMGVARDEYQALGPLLKRLNATLACTRKVADCGWLPRTRQVGLTGHHVAPRLYVAIGLRGGFNHTIGIRRSRVILAVNSDRDAPIFSDADIGVVGDWREVLPLLCQQLEKVLHERTTHALAKSRTSTSRSRPAGRHPPADAFNPKPPSRRIT
jgi:electron transfer flavoprotein alpha subunit